MVGLVESQIADDRIGTGRARLTDGLIDGEDVSRDGGPECPTRDPQQAQKSKAKADRLISLK